jgi:hypothetical protein
MKFSESYGSVRQHNSSNSLSLSPSCSAVNAIQSLELANLAGHGKGLNLPNDTQAWKSMGSLHHPAALVPGGVFPGSKPRVCSS